MPEITPRAIDNAGGKEEVSAPVAGETSTAQTREKEFRALMEGEYKDLFTAYFQETFNRRFREQKEMVEELKTARGVLSEVAAHYGVGEGEILAAIRAENEKNASADRRAATPPTDEEERALEERIRAAVAEAVAATRRETEQVLLASIRARGLRPTESALQCEGERALRPDAARLSREQRAEVARRAAKGETITF